MGRTCTIALGQMGESRAGGEANLAVMERMTAEAAGRGADLICFPELAQTGYFVRREELETLAEPADGDFAGRLSDCARRNGVWVAAGYAEREGEAIYNSCLLLDRKGRTAGNVRKVHLWKSEKKRFCAGTTFPVFDTELGCLAILPCYDLEFPEPARIAAMKGAELILCPAAWSRPAKNRWELDLRANSLFNLLFTAGANYADGLCCGCSAVAGPDGSFLGAASGDSEEVLVVTANLDEIAGHRERIPYFQDLRTDLIVRELQGLVHSAGEES